MTKKMCRICLGNGTMSSIFQKQEKLMISSIIMSLSHVHIYPGDGLPNTICAKCILKLNKCIEFIDLCKISDLKLREMSASNNEISNTTRPNASDVLDSEKSNSQLNEAKDLINDEIVIKQDNEKLKSKEESCIKVPGQLNDKKVEKQQCFTCGKVMSSRFRLKTHLRTHTGERPFSCPHCSKNFSLAQNLKVHLRTHTGEKPLQCSICGESFAQSAGLAAHKRKHTGQTPYRCVLCPRSFRTVGHLQYHVRRHTGEKNFECETCNRAFITRSDLKQHILTHTGDRPHVCCMCGLRLTRASHLKRHIQHLHNGLGPFKCTKCPLSFIMKSDFEKHKKKHKESEEI